VFYSVSDQRMLQLIATMREVFVRQSPEIVNGGSQHPEVRHRQHISRRGWRSQAARCSSGPRCAAERPSLGFDPSGDLA